MHTDVAVTAVVFVLAIVVFVIPVKGAADGPVVYYLKATDRPLFIVFNYTLNQSVLPFRRMVCSWLIEADYSDFNVQLDFPDFHLLNSSAAQRGDCLDVYDGNDVQLNRKNLLAELCDRLPESVYLSTGRFLRVIYRQGNVGGHRWFSFNYTMVDPPKTASTNPFWASTVGRIVAFIIIMVIFSTCSWIINCLKRRRLNGNSTGLCGWLAKNLSFDCQRIGHGLCDLRRQLSSSCYRCKNYFRSDGAIQREVATHAITACQSRSEGRSGSVEGTSGDTVISTFSISRPNLSAVVFNDRNDPLSASVSACSDYNDPPPNYFSISPRYDLGQLTGRSTGRVAELSPPQPPQYSMLFPSLSEDLYGTESLAFQTPPTPDDISAPPSYNQADPPSYNQPAALQLYDQAELPSCNQLEVPPSYDQVEPPFCNQPIVLPSYDQVEPPFCNQPVVPPSYDQVEPPFCNQPVVPSSYDRVESPSFNQLATLTDHQVEPPFCDQPVPPIYEQP